MVCSSFCVILAFSAARRHTKQVSALKLYARTIAFYTSLVYTISVCAAWKPAAQGIAPQRGGRRERNMDIAVGDTIQTRKKHPCGASSFEVLRVGMDFKIRCTGCGREVMLPRAKIEKNIKKVLKPGAAE